MSDEHTTAATMRTVPPGHVVLAPSIDPVRRGRFEDAYGYGVRIRIYSGSTSGTCSRCGHAVWIGPRSVELVDAGVAHPICETCLGEAMALTGWRPRAIANLENPEGNHA